MGQKSSPGQHLNNEVDKTVFYWPWPRYISLTDTQEWAPIWESGVPPWMVDGDRGSSWSWLLDLTERWAVEEDRVEEGRSEAPSPRITAWPELPFSDSGSPLLTLSPLAPDSTSLPVDDSTWQIYVATSCQRAGVGFYYTLMDAPQTILPFLSIHFISNNTYSRPRTHFKRSKTV